MARVVAAGVPHHITQRGNNRQDVFLLDDDRRFYLETLRERSQRHGVTLLGYCLMTNHVHLVAIPERPDSLARALGGSRRPKREFGISPRSPPPPPISPISKKACYAPNLPSGTRQVLLIHIYQMTLLASLRWSIEVHASPAPAV